MSDKSNKYGYVGADIPAQSFGSNKGVFNPAEINELVADNKWTSFGQLELIETQDVTTVGTVDFLSIDESIYNVHFLTGTLNDASGGYGLYYNLYESGVLETASVYGIAQQRGRSNGTFDEVRSSAVGTPWIINSSNTNQSVCFYIYFYNLGDSTKYSFSTSHSSFLYAGTNDETFMFGSGVLSQASTVDGIRIKTNANTFTGTLSLYGIRYS